MNLISKQLKIYQIGLKKEEIGVQWVSKKVFNSTSETLQKQVLIQALKLRLRIYLFNSTGLLKLYLRFQPMFIHLLDQILKIFKRKNLLNLMKLLCFLIKKLFKMLLKMKLKRWLGKKYMLLFHM